MTDVQQQQPSLYVTIPIFIFSICLFSVFIVALWQYKEIDGLFYHGIVNVVIIILSCILSCFPLGDLFTQINGFIGLIMLMLGFVFFKQTTDFSIFELASMGGKWMEYPLLICYYYIALWFTVVVVGFCFIVLLALLTLLLWGIILF